MNPFYNDTDTPLFDNENNTSNLLKDELTEKDVESMERYVNIISTIEENARKSKSHTFSMGLLIFVLTALCFIVITEYLVTAENAYTKELFDFFKYLATTLIGYLFASHTKKDMK